MKIKRSSYIKFTLLLLATIVTAISASAQSFECTSDLYQVVNGKELKVLLPANGTYETVGTSDISYNGAGFNVEDGFIYGIGTGTALVRIDNTGSATDLGSISGFSALSYSGDFDLEGNWYSFKKTNSNWIMNKIDVSSQPPVAEEFSITELAGVSNANQTADMSYNAIANKFYGMNAGTLIEFDPFNRTVKAVADYSAEAESGSYGAVWSDQTGKTYFFNNNTGNIYRAEMDRDGSILSFAFLSTSSPNGQNDGMGCPMAQSPIFPEICDNGLDDDGDGLIDCEDPDCTSTTSCGVSGVIYSSSVACRQSIVTYHTFFTNNSNLTNSITVTEELPQGFIFLQDTIEFDLHGFSDFTNQPTEGDDGMISWGTLTLLPGETVRISYDVTLNENAQTGIQTDNLSVVLDRSGTIFSPSVLSSEILVGDCPTADTYSCEPAFYQVYQKKGKNQPNVYGRLDPITGDYDAIAIASDYANGLGYDINSGLVYGASGRRFISLDENGIVLDQGISFEQNVYRGDINENSEWYGAVGNNMVKIDVSGSPVIVDTYSGQGLPGWDMAYNKNGHFYAIHNQSLYQFNTETDTKSTVGTLVGSGIPTSGGYGAQWTGSDGYLYASHNLTGVILRVDVITAESRVVSLSTDGLKKNDGFSCPTDIPVVYEFDYGDNSRLPQSRILSYKQDLGQDDIPDFSTFWLGNAVNYETSSPANTDATGDLDDGFTMTTETDNNTLTAVYGLNTNIEGTAYFLTGFDWDDDGTFDQIISSSEVLTTANTIINTIDLPASFVEGSVNVRVIISEKELNDSQISGDILELGEVEDYRYYITPPCEGPECEVSTGTNGGLESNGDLATAIATRNYGRIKANSKVHLKENQPNLRSYKQARVSGEGSLNKYFPEVGATGHEESTVSSPEDLVSITNANGVFAVDYYLDDLRVAASLLLTTENSVYNHSKNVCDRLNGKSIEDVQLINIDGISIIFAKISHESGAIEYSSWFSAKSTDNSYEIFSQWNVDKYPTGDYLNFQVWSSSPKQVMHIIEHAVNELAAEKKISTNNTIMQLPKVIVKNGHYENGKLKLSLINKNNAHSITLESSTRRSEQDDFSNESYLINLTGELEQEVVIETGFLFDAGISLKVEDKDAYDALYLADGAWGTDYNEDFSSIRSFITHEVETGTEIETNEYLVERGITINGQTSDVVNVFRNVKAGEKSLSTASFNTLSFEVQNSGPLEVVLVEKGLIDWDDRLRIKVPSHLDKTKVNVSLNDFTGTQLKDDLEIQSIVFSYINQSGEQEEFEFSLANVIFGNQNVLSADDQLLETSAFQIYPNPASDYLMIHLPKTTETANVRIVDMAGQVIMSQNINSYKNRLDLALKPGLYHVIMEDHNTRMTQSLIVR